MSNPPKSTRVRRKLSVRVVITLMACASLVAGSGTGFWMWSSNTLAVSEHEYASAAAIVDDAREAALAKKAEQANAARATLAAATLAAEQQAALDKSMADQGWSSAGNEIYFQFADSNDYTCGYFDCAYVNVHVVNACNAGVYLSASILDGTTAVGLDNGVTGGLPAGGNAQILLQDTRGGGTFSITDLHCMG